MGWAAAEDSEGGLDVGPASLQRWHLVNGRIGVVLAGQAGWPGGVAADERSEDLDHGQPAGWGVVCDAFQGVDAAQADVEPVSARLAELVDSAGEPLGEETLIAALGLLAGEFELLAGAVVAALGLLAGVLKLLSTDANLPQGDCGAYAGAAEDQHGGQGLEQGDAGVVLELIAAFAACGLVSRG